MLKVGIRSYLRTLGSDGVARFAAVTGLKSTWGWGGQSIPLGMGCVCKSSPKRLTKAGRPVWNVGGTTPQNRAPDGVLKRGVWKNSAS